MSKRIFCKTRVSTKKIPFSVLGGLTGICVVLIVSTANAKPPTDTAQLPAALNPCIPSTQVAKAEYISKFYLRSAKYYLLSAYELNDSQPSDLVITLEGDRCQLVFYNATGDAIPLANSVGKEVARQLTLGRYQREIKKIGREEFQKQLNESAAQENQVVWWDEEVWALQQLALKVPRNVVVKQ